MNKLTKIPIENKIYTIIKIIMIIFEKNHKRKEAKIV